MKLPVLLHCTCDVTIVLLLLGSIRISRCGIRRGINIEMQFPCVLSLTNITHIKKKTECLCGYALTLK